MPDITLVIGNKNYSSWSLRAWLALKKTDLPFTEELIPLGEPGYKEKLLAYAPNGKVPILKHGELIVWDSLAIIEYLAEISEEAELWPSDTGERAIARSLAAHMHSGFLRIRKTYHMDIKHHATSPAVPDEKVLKEIQELERLWEGTYRRYGAGKGDYLFGSWSLADMMFAPMALRFASYMLPTEQNFTQSYIEAIIHHPHVKLWCDAAQQESWVIDFH
jgi:glutathione S-transferase